VRQAFSDFDLSGFWNEDEYYAREFTSEPLSEEKVRLVEDSLGYKLPSSYVELMAHRNGGAPRKNCHRTSTPHRGRGITSRWKPFLQLVQTNSFPCAARLEADS